MLRLAIPVAAASLALLGVVYASSNWNWFTAAAARQSTDDATISADFSTMSARVSGNIQNVAVADFQLIRRGDLIAEIDPREYDAAADLASANLSAAQASRANLINQETLQRAAITAADAQHSSALAALEQSRLELERQKNLGPASTEQKLQQARAAFLQAEASVASTSAAADQQKAQLMVLKGQEPLLDAQIAAQNANLATAQLHRQFSRISAPFDGVVGKSSVHVGDFVGVGASIITVVPLPRVYVTANFKETQLARMEIGQRAEVRVDTFPNRVFTGRVSKLAPASGSTFALLPPDNATGNFTKVVQRVSVRVELDGGQSLIDQLKPGMSAVVAVDTSEQLR